MKRPVQRPHIIVCFDYCLKIGLCDYTRTVTFDLHSLTFYSNHTALKKIPRLSCLCPDFSHVCSLRLAADQSIEEDATSGSTFLEGSDRANIKAPMPPLICRRVNQIIQPQSCIFNPRVAKLSSSTALSTTIDSGRKNAAQI